LLFLSVRFRHRFSKSYQREFRRIAIKAKREGRKTIARWYHFFLKGQRRFREQILIDRVR
jgi:hypothetical protein